jgi:hypothetical protein
VKVFNINQKKTLTVGFSRSPRLLSKIIRWVEGSEVSHVYIKFRSDFLERDIIYEASGTEVKFVNEFTFLKRSEVIAEFDLSIPVQEYRRAVQYAMDQVGKPYGFLSLIGLGLVKVANKFGYRTKNVFKDGNRAYICSELTAEVLETFMTLPTEIPVEYLTPTDLYKIFLDSFKKK